MNWFVQNLIAFFGGNAMEIFPRYDGSSRRWKNFILASGSILLTTFFQVQLFAMNGQRPNIIVILVDDMGYGDPQCYNPMSKIPTPNIDRLAREGMRFLDAHSPGALCHPSRYGLLTGQYPFRTNISKWPTQPLIEPEQSTFASMLREAGYRTSMVGKWHLGFEELGYDKILAGGPQDRGFDSFFGMRASTDIPPYFFIRGDRAEEPPTLSIAGSQSPDWSPIQGAFWRAGRIASKLKLDRVLETFTNEAIEIIHNHTRQEPTGSNPFLLYLAYTGPHTPWLPSAEFVGKSGAGLYGDFAMMVDSEIGRVLKSLDDHQLVKDTLVLFTSDNGPTWYPENTQKFGHDSAGGWRGMKADLWEAGHRMPLIVRWPREVQPGSISAQTICFTDVYATLAEIAGVDISRNNRLDSTSFLPVLTARQQESIPIRGPIVIRAGSTNAMMIRNGPWKLIDQLGSGGFTQPSRIVPKPGEPVGQLYNLQWDPKESNNLYMEHPDIVQRLTQEMTRIVANKTPLSPNP